MGRFQKYLCSVAVFATCSLAAATAFGQDAPMRDAVSADIQATFGSVPSFIGLVADSALAGLWQETKALELSGDTALDVKTKALISLAVASQIPCDYCIWQDTNSARQAGASDQEIAEAVAMAGLTRNWSTIFHGMQVDMATFRKELGGM